MVLTPSLHDQQQHSLHSWLELAPSMNQAPRTLYFGDGDDDYDDEAPRTLYF